MQATVHAGILPVAGKYRLSNAGIFIGNQEILPTGIAGNAGSKCRHFPPAACRQHSIAGMQATPFLQHHIHICTIYIQMFLGFVFWHFFLDFLFYCCFCRFSSFEVFFLIFVPRDFSGYGTISHFMYILEVQIIYRSVRLQII